MVVRRCAVGAMLVAALAVAFAPAQHVAELKAQHVAALKARQAAARPPSEPAAANPIPPTGFTAHDTTVNGIRIHYVIGGNGPTLVLLHGYPETSYAWFRVMPQLARHYTIVAPDLRGAGGSSAPPDGYDKVTMAMDVHALLASLGRTQGVNVVGHDIGSMVAYAYAGSYRNDVAKLVLSEAPIPDRSVYGSPAVTALGSGLQSFGFGLPEDAVRGREAQWVSGFQGWLAGDKSVFTPQDTSVYARALRDPDHLRAGFEWFRAFPADNREVDVMGKQRLTIPVLAVGADHGLGASVGEQARLYADDVEATVVKESGHWIWQEQPPLMADLLLDFLGSAD
jgi:pimeloyl-ACP methyl ester carboxylesterase